MVLGSCRRCRVHPKNAAKPRNVDSTESYGAQLNERADQEGQSHERPAKDDFN